MDLKINKKYKSDTVCCLKTDKKTSVTVCLRCQWLRIVLPDIVKCYYSKEKEQYENNIARITSYGTIFDKQIKLEVFVTFQTNVQKEKVTFALLV